MKWTQVPLSFQLESKPMPIRVLSKSDEVRSRGTPEIFTKKTKPVAKVKSRGILESKVPKVGAHYEINLEETLSLRED